MEEFFNSPDGEEEGQAVKKGGGRRRLHSGTPAWSGGFPGSSGWSWLGGRAACICCAAGASLHGWHPRPGLSQGLGRFTRPADRYNPGTATVWVSRPRRRAVLARGSRPARQSPAHGNGADWGTDPRESGAVPVLSLPVRPCRVRGNMPLPLLGNQIVSLGIASAGFHLGEGPTIKKGLKEVVEERLAPRHTGRGPPPTARCTACTTPNPTTPASTCPTTPRACHRGLFV